MPSAFPGFPPEGLAFLRSLARNNRREWFQPRKAIYEEQVKRPLRELVEALNRDLVKFLPEYVTDPDQSVYRIYRDTRFSPDKTPYKDHIAASFHRRGSCAHGEGGFYISVSPKTVGIAGGVYMPAPEELRAIREYLAQHYPEFRRILASAKVRSFFGELAGEQLSRVPKGFAADHPAADLLRFKRWVLYRKLPPELAGTPALHPEIITSLRAMAPFLRFLAAPLGAKKKGIDARELFA